MRGKKLDLGIEKLVYHFSLNIGHQNMSLYIRRSKKRRRKLVQRKRAKGIQAVESETKPS